MPLLDSHNIQRSAATLWKDSTMVITYGTLARLSLFYVHSESNGIKGANPRISTLCHREDAELLRLSS